MLIYQYRRKTKMSKNFVDTLSANCGNLENGMCRRFRLENWKKKCRFLIQFIEKKFTFLVTTIQEFLIERQDFFLIFCIFHLKVLDLENQKFIEINRFLHQNELSSSYCCRAIIDIGIEIKQKNIFENYLLF